MLIDKWWFGPLFAKSEEGSEGGGADDSAEGDSEDSKEGSEDEEEGDSESGEEDEEDKEGDEDKGEGELTAEQIKEATNLYKLLSNKETQTQTLKILATQAGIALNDGKLPETKKEIKDAVKNTVQILEEALGKDLAWLAPKLAAAFDQLLEKSEGKTKEQLESMKQTQIAKEVDNAYEKLARETNGESKKFESRMVGLADKLYPAPGMSTEEYVRMLYTIASASGEKKSAKLRLAEKINKNSKDVPGRLTESSTSGGGKANTNNGRMSIKDAVRQAAAKQGYKGD